jgi:uncharacterized protein YyaL (SSP411 family)
MHFSPRPNRAAEIRWRRWGDAAFKEAAAADKPVLLGISAVWCHWCHVMDETTYSSPAVIDLINERYIPVRVDNDQRPDVNARYNMGGWPTTAILTPEGEVLKGATYVPPDAMQALLTQIADVYADPSSRLEIAKRVAELKVLRAGRPLSPASAQLDASIPAQVERTLAEQFDEQYGGFGQEPKFPQTPALHFLLDLCVRSPNERAQTMAQKSLHAMAGGGMYDHVEGGFFRYSTTRDFSVPHFEKMLEDLGALLPACARAAALFDDGVLKSVAFDVKRYMDEHLWNAAFGAYGGSQDADEEYYKLDAAQRQKRAQPYVDPLIYTSWNAQAAYGLLEAGPLLQHGDGAARSSWTERGLTVLETLWSRCAIDGLLCRYYDGRAHVRGLLGDQAWYLWSALSAFSVTGDDVWLRRAAQLIDALEALYDPASEGYRDRLVSGDEAGRVADPAVPMDDNALMARALASYSAFVDRPDLAQRAKAILARYASAYRSMGSFAAGYASAVLDVLQPPVDVKIVAPWNSAQAQEWRGEALSRAKPALRVDTLDPARDTSRIASLGYISAPEPAAYLCEANACFARARNAAELRAALAGLTQNVSAAHGTAT